jgi:hypothetical protein
MASPLHEARPRALGERDQHGEGWIGPGHRRHDRDRPEGERGEQREGGEREENAGDRHKPKFRLPEATSLPAISIHALNTISPASVTARTVGMGPTAREGKRAAKSWTPQLSAATGPNKLSS